MIIGYIYSQKCNENAIKKRLIYFELWKHFFVLITGKIFYWSEFILKEITFLKIHTLNIFKQFVGFLHNVHHFLPGFLEWWSQRPGILWAGIFSLRKKLNSFMQLDVWPISTSLLGCYKTLVFDSRHLMRLDERC